MKKTTKIGFLLTVTIFFCLQVFGHPQKPDYQFYCSRYLQLQKKPTPQAIMIRSVIIPGWGQLTNRQWWKVPIIYGGLGTTGYFALYWDKWYLDVRDAYRLRTDNDPLTLDKYDPANPSAKRYYSESQLLWFRDRYRKNLELSVIIFSGVYLLNVIDAYVGAQLRDFDVSDDLSIHIQPFGKIEYFHEKPVFTNGLTINLRI